MTKNEPFNETRSVGKRSFDDGVPFVKMTSFIKKGGHMFKKKAFICLTRLMNNFPACTKTISKVSRTNETRRTAEILNNKGLE